MLRQGVFIDEHGDEYTIYNEIGPGFERLDFVRRGANYNIDTDAIVYSRVDSHGIFTYGDERVYRDYMALKDALAQYNVTPTTTHGWKLGKYYSTVTKQDNDTDMYEEQELCNGKWSSYSARIGKRSIALMIALEASQANTMPLNFAEYTEAALSRESVESQEAPYYPLSVLRARYNIKHLDGYDFVVADSDELAKQRLDAWLASENKILGVDTETTGLDIDMYGKDKLVGIILSYKYGEATYYPVAHTKFNNISNDFLLNSLLPAIKSREDRLVAHNAKFERKVFLHYGYAVQIRYDTMVLSFLVNPIIERGAHGLKELMEKATGLKFLELTDIFVSSKLINFAVLPKDIVRAYACPDASSIIFLFDWLWKKLPAYTRMLANVEFELVSVKADQEYYGMRVDMDIFKKNMDNCDYIIAMLEKAFRILTNVDGNINSSQMLSDLIYGKMNCPVLTRTKTGKPATSAATIKKLAAIKLDTPTETPIQEDLKDLYGNVVIKKDVINKAKYPALVVLEKYRVYFKLRSAFYNRFERTSKSGRIFFWVNQNGATTGRQSSPMHQLPGELKKCILPDSDDHVMWDPDYSQVELRMIAFLAQQKDLIELCCDPENDIHRAIGALITGKEMWQISAEERKMGKRRNFGVIYLISAYGLAGQIYGPGYTKEQVEICQKSLDEFFHRFKRIRNFLAMNALKITQQGYLSTYFGRNKYFNEIFSPNITNRKRTSLIRQGNNLPVQGTAADYMKIAETNYQRYIHNKGWDVPMKNGFPRVRVALSIHDEVILMADKTIPYEEIIQMIKACMEMPVEGAPPFFVAPAKVSNWAQHDDDSVSMPVLLRDKLIEDYNKTGISQINEENYQQVLDDYRDKVLHDYMAETISKYGPDPTNVGNHVRHPSLTHELISRYPAPRNLGLSHEESIIWAATEYMKSEHVPMAAAESTREQNPSELIDITEYNTLVTFDNEGNVVYETPEDEIAMDDDVAGAYDDAKLAHDLLNEEYYVWELMDAIVLDVSSLDLKDVDTVIAAVWPLRQDDGYYRVLLSYGGKLVDTGFRVEDIDQIEINNYIKQLKGSVSYA